MTSPLAFITLDFDPLLSLGPLAVRWQTIGVTAGLLLALALAALLTRRIPDLTLILVSIVPGAVVGGRLVHVLDFVGAYAANPVSIVDPRVGSLSLLGAAARARPSTVRGPWPLPATDRGSASHLPSPRIRHRCMRACGCYSESRSSCVSRDRVAQARMCTRGSRGRSDRRPLGCCSSVPWGGFWPAGLSSASRGAMNLWLDF